MFKNVIQKKAIALLTAAALAVSGLAGVQLVNAADSVDMTGWQDSIAVDFGTGTNVTDGVDTDLSTSSKLSEIGYTVTQPVVAGYGTYLYDTTDVGTLYGKEATTQHFGFDRVLPSGVTSVGGAHFRDWVFAPDGEEYKLSVDLKPGQYYVYVYTGNRVSNYNNTTFVAFNDIPGVAYDQTSAGGSQWGSVDANYAEAVYVVDVAAQENGAGKLVVTFYDDTIIKAEDGSYDAAFTTSNTFFVNDDVNTANVTYNLNGVECDGQAVTARLNGIEIIPVESPVHAESVTADSQMVVEINETKNLTYTVAPENVTDRLAFVSANPGVAKVDALTGAVTGVAKGTTEVTVYTSSGKTAVVPVEVKGETILKLDKSSVELYVDGEEGTNTAMVMASFSADNAEAATAVLQLPANNEYVTYTLGECKAAAEEGMYEQEITITAVAPGEAELTVVRGDTQKEATCSIEVIRPVKEVKFVDGEGKDVTEYVVPINGELTVLGKAFPENASNTKVTYAVEDKSVATVSASSGKITPKAIGETTITVKASDNAEIIKSIPLKVVASVGTVALDKTTLDMKVGETANLTATLQPAAGTDEITDNSVTWSSSNTAVATVVNGIVSAVSAGTADITVTSVESGISAKCVVTVKANAVTPTSPVVVPVKATSVKVTAKTKTLKKLGASTTVTAAMLPANAVDTIKWSSSNTKVATVSAAGKVVAKGPGKAVITATTSGGVKGTVTIKVLSPAKRIKVNKKTVSLKKGKTFKLLVKVTPSNSTDKVTYKSKNSKIATVSRKGVIKGKKKGTTKITVKAGKKTVKVTVKVK